MRPDGLIWWYKARLVVKGFTQKFVLDYFDPYSPVMNISMIRALFLLVSIHKLRVHQIDVKTAFLKGDLDEEIYMRTMNYTRPDIAYDVSRLSRYTHNPSGEHWIALKRLLKYLKGTLDWKLEFVGFPAVLEGYCDANWVFDNDESEFIALDLAGQETEWLRSLLADILLWGRPTTQISLLCDSQVAICVAKNEAYNGKKKHIRIRSAIPPAVHSGFGCTEFGATMLTSGDGPPTAAITHIGAYSFLRQCSLFYQHINMLGGKHLSILLEPYHAHGFITYVSFHYVRKQCLVPIVFQNYKTFEVNGPVKRPMKLSMHQLVNKSQSLEFSVTLVCAVNRRKEQNKVKQMIEVGSLARNIDCYPLRSLHVLARRFCHLMSLHFGNVPVLVVSSAGATHEITKTHDLIFINRPKRSFFHILLYDYKDVASARYDEFWRKMRSICVLNLLINLSELFSMTTNNVICIITLGRKCSEDTGKLKKFLWEFTELLSTSDVGDYLPWLAWVSHVNGFKAKAKKVAKELMNFLME
ncbi:Cytochrome P450 71A1 [Hibiscus syriacus]|uniref:Cytochrome P450 71A1 n=1 Tax=Hibiscus syriacus TaxID=106335 RepID=A0A6A3AP53_HIBSY|nr:Cytochrome P450 71A1 [Hibiscus syriacus]